jgi:hypothetical protein
MAHAPGAVKQARRLGRGARIRNQRVATGVLEMGFACIIEGWRCATFDHLQLKGSHMKPNHPVIRLLALGLLALLTACDLSTAPTPTPVPVPPATPAPATATVPPASPTPVAVPPSPTPEAATPDPSKPVIVYEKSGGIAGIHDVLEIYGDGTVRWTPSRQPSVTARISADQLAQLRAQFDAAHFFDLAAEYDHHNVADDFYYTVTYTANGQTKQVKAADVGGKGLTPPALDALIAALQQVAGQAAAQGTPAATPAAGDTPTAAPSGPTATMPPVPATATAVPGTSLLEIVFARSGGLAGTSDTLEIGGNGEAHLSSRGQPTGATTLAAAQLNTLLAQFDQAGFFGLQDRYDSGTVADDIYNTITLSRNGQTKTVTVAEVGGQGLAPAALADLITTLRQIADTIRAQPVPASPTPAASPITRPTTGPTEGADLLVYRVQGGIAGLDTAMFIDRRGGVRFTSRGADTGTAQMSQDDLRGLIDLLNAADFFNLQDRYAPPAAPADSQTLTVTYNSGGRSKTVSVESGATEPPSYTPVLVRLQALQTQLQPR